MVRRAIAVLSVAASVPAGASDRPPETVYKHVCGYCHGVNVGPVIRGRALEPEATRYIVRHGQNAMPAFRPTEITDSELRSLSLWIQASKPDPREHGQ